MPLKLSQLPIQKTSFLLKLITTEFMLGGDVFLQGSLRTFVRNLYFIYIMKKYHFLSKTESFYIIDPFYIKIDNNIFSCRFDLNSSLLILKQK